MQGFGLLDIIAFAWFVVAWAGYGALMEWSALGRHSLNHRMDVYRAEWTRRMLAREMRMVDGQIMGSLQNGTAFFASTSLVVIGGVFALLRAAEDVLQIFATLPFGIETTRAVWETKVLGLLVIYIYAFFKFSWSYRLFNYGAILMGATPEAMDKDEDFARAAADRVARMTTLAGRHFNRGQRAFFFALAYLGWFVNAWLFMAATAAVFVVIAVRQFGPAARHVLGEPAS
ncbi:MAG: DUF599 family protein [Bradyrhizobiaceae bacterium]|nr:DUF599 family protein [Bradyrhizobiaceae bacterium]